MAYLRTILTILAAIVAYLFVIPIIVLYYPFSKDKNTPFLLATWIWDKAILLAAGIKLTVNGRQHLYNFPPSTIIISNHASYLDIPILGSIFPLNVRFVARENLFRAPFLGWIMRHSGHVAIERKGTRQTLKTMLNTAEKVKHGMPVLIFPEGTRSPDGEIKEFKAGSMLIASRAKAAIIPIAITGSHDIMPRHRFLIQPTSVTVNIGEPILAYQDENQKVDEDKLLQDLKDRIQGLLEQS